MLDTSFPPQNKWNLTLASGMRRNRGGWADIRSSLPPERAFAEPVLGSWAGGMVLQRRAAYVRALSSATTVSAMRDKRLDVSVSFDSRRGYFTTGSELPQSVTALSLGGLRRRIEVALLPDEPARIGDIVRIASAAGHSKLTGCDPIIGHPMLQAFQNYEQQYSIACLRIQTEKSWQPDGTAGLPSIGADIPTSPE
jgi:hypothetical protein